MPDLQSLIDESVAHDRALAVQVADATADLTLTAAYVVVPGCAITVTLPRGHKALFIVNANIRNTGVGTSGIGQAALFIDGVQHLTDSSAAKHVVGAGAGVTIDVQSNSTKTYVVTGDSLEHTWAIRAKKTDTVGTPAITIEEEATDLTFIPLG